MNNTFDQRSQTEPWSLASLGRRDTSGSHWVYVLPLVSVLAPALNQMLHPRPFHYIVVPYWLLAAALFVIVVHAVRPTVLTWALIFLPYALVAFFLFYFRIKNFDFDLPWLLWDMVPAVAAVIVYRGRPHAASIETSILAVLVAFLCVGWYVIPQFVFE